MRSALATIVCLLASLACVDSSAYRGAPPPAPAPTPAADATAVATFAGGCFWCMEPPFEQLDGVASVVSGYTGGEIENPSYGQVSSGRTAHAEAVRIRYDPTRVSYEQLLRVFWRQIDPTDGGGQFADRGRQYRTAIFHHDGEQRRLALESRADLEASGRFDRPIATEIVEAGPFYDAEEYHQDYYKKNSAHYKAYRRGSGREAFIERVWGRDVEPATRGGYVKPSKEELRQKLNPLQYHVTQEEGTERAFTGEYWDNKRAGIYVDVVSGEALFASSDKFESGTGWPSFTRPLEGGAVVEKRDSTLGMVRTEVRSQKADSHLGHVFNDGPRPDGLRYCINSAALRFVPAEDLEKEGYGEYAELFQAAKTE